MSFTTPDSEPLFVPCYVPGRRLSALLRLLRVVSVDELTSQGQPGVNALLDGFVLPGNFVRLQVVQQQGNPLLWRLLKRFGEQASAPLLVNTFGEPLVKQRDAVRSHFCSGIDALVIDNFVLSKTASKIVPSSMSLQKAC